MQARKIFALVLMTATIASCSMGMGYGAGSGMGYSGGSSGGPSISGFAFHPATITASSGATLTWTNYDTTAHTVTETAVTPAFDSGSIAPGATYSLVLKVPGTYAYHCSIHASMTGTIVVQ
ncbi:MAG: plastocyanin/azurin family copper-binding protein [Spirochaetia bacterium]|jgi:plastocyanin